jgi:rod shape-determining protein MreC
VSFAPDTFASRRDTLAFAVCLIAAVAARVAPPVVQDTVASVVSSSVLAPFLALQRQAELLRASRARYGEMASLRDSALAAGFALQEVDEENERLRELLGLSARLPVTHVGAEVLHQSSPAAGLLAVLSVGRDRGVRAGNPVVAPGGLAGVVQSVTASTATALLWTHPDFRVSAMTLDGAVYGIAGPAGGNGPNTMLMELRGVPYRETLEPGTPVYTSGLGGAAGVYPRGIPVGTILAVGEEREGWSRTYVMRPAVHPASITHVVVLMGFALDLRGVFEESAP